MFIFARCLGSSAAVTPAKYELDIIKVTTVFMIRKNWENNGAAKIGLVTPTPEMKCFIGEQICLKCHSKAPIKTSMSKIYEQIFVFVRVDLFH